MAEQEQTLALKEMSNYNKSQETKSTETTGSNVRGAVKSTPASTSTTPDFMKTGKKNPKLWENTLLNTVKNGGITKEKPSSVNLPDLGKRSTDSATGEDDFTAWIKDKNKTLSFVKDLPNRDERAFGAAIFGKEAEERAYNRSVVEEMQKIGLAPNKTQDQLFREGFYGIESDPDYTAILKNAIKTSQKETPIQFLERRNREVQNQKLRESQSYGGAKNNFGMESPYPTKAADRIVETETNDGDNTYVDSVLSNAHQNIKLGEMVTDIAKPVLKVLSNADIPGCNIKGGGKALSKVIKPLNLIFGVGDYGMSVYEDLNAGQSVTRAFLGNAINKLSSEVYSGVCSLGGVAVGACVGTTHVPVFGTAVYAAAGGISAGILSQNAADEFGNKVEKAFFEPTPEALLIFD